MPDSESTLSIGIVVLYAVGGFISFIFSMFTFLLIRKIRKDEKFTARVIAKNKLYQTKFDVLIVAFRTMEGDYAEFGKALNASFEKEWGRRRAEDEELRKITEDEITN
jgi:hypothetical protein